MLLSNEFKSKSIEEFLQWNFKCTLITIFSIEFISKPRSYFRRREHLMPQGSELPTLGGSFQEWFAGKGLKLEKVHYFLSLRFENVREHCV